MQLLEYYKWELQLKNGDIIVQSKDNEPEPFKFDGRNSDFKNIKIFKLIPKDKESSLKEYKLTLPNEAILIYFRKTIANTGNLFPKFQVNLIGWQMNVSGKKIKQITFIYPNGDIENTPDDLTLLEKFIESLPKKDIKDIVGCSGCKPKLVKEEPNEK